MERTYAVTGAASGIGAATTAWLRARGARVIACDPSITSDGTEDGVEVVAWSDPAAMVAKAAEKFAGRLDAIVISSAMPAPRTPVVQKSGPALSKPQSTRLGGSQAARP